MRKIIIRGAIVVVILLAGTGVFQWHNYQQKIEYRKEALLYLKKIILKQSHTWKKR